MNHPLAALSAFAQNPVLTGLHLGTRLGIVGGIAEVALGAKEFDQANDGDPLAVYGPAETARQAADLLAHAYHYRPADLEKAGEMSPLQQFYRIIAPRTVRQAGGVISRQIAELSSSFDPIWMAEGLGFFNPNIIHWAGLGVLTPEAAPFFETLQLKLGDRINLLAGMQEEILFALGREFPRSDLYDSSKWKRRLLGYGAVAGFSLLLNGFTDPSFFMVIGGVIAGAEGHDVVKHFVRTGQRRRALSAVQNTSANAKIKKLEEKRDVVKAVLEKLASAS